MSKEEIIAFLMQKKGLTVAVQNARADLVAAQQEYGKFKKTSTRWLLLIIFVLPFLLGVVFSPFGDTVTNLMSIVWIGAIAYAVYLRIQGGRRANGKINEAKEKLVAEQNQPEYQKGMQDFPQKFYSYWTIDRLIHLVQENRATTLQEAFNVAENQDFQHDQLAIQQENLAVSKSTNSAAKTSAIANVFTAMNTRR